MNESDLEQELRSLLPSRPSLRLGERIAEELSAPNRPPEQASGMLERPVRKPADLRRWFLALVGATAVIIALLVIASQMGPKPALTETKPASTTAVAALSETPDESVAELIDAQDDGLVFEGDEPQRQVRMTYLERHTWTNPVTGAVVEIEVPREDIVLMPVAMQ